MKVLFGGVINESLVRGAGTQNDGVKGSDQVGGEFRFKPLGDFRYGTVATAHFDRTIPLGGHFQIHSAGMGRGHHEKTHGHDDQNEKSPYTKSRKHAKTF